MKLRIFRLFAALLLGSGFAMGQTESYTNFVRQIQYPSGVVWDASVAASGEQLSELAIDPGGARFELWTVNSNGPTSHLLSSTYVGTYIPIVDLKIVSEDQTSTVLRTRADRPFTVLLSVSGLRNGEIDPDASKAVKFLRHIQSYGDKGTGINIDRTQASLMTQTLVSENGTQTLNFALTSVPNADLSKVRGEERFSVFSLPDYQAPASQVAAQTIQIWPVADGSISGISQNQKIRFLLPQLTLTLNDLYPNSTTYLQVYKGTQKLGETGKVVPGSALVVNDSIPVDRTLTVNSYDSVFGEGPDSDGTWTMELVTSTPFGLDRLAYVTFELKRTIKVNGNVNTIE